MSSSPLPCVLAALLASGCATVDPRPDYARAREEIRATTGEADVHDPDEPSPTADEVRAILADGLGLTEATRLALLDNRRLQAGFLELGVARAEYVQAGLLENPSLSLAFLIPDVGGRVRWTADLAASVAELWRIPARQARAEAEVDRRILELSRFAGELVAATKETYFEGVAARESRSIAAENLELARRSLAGVRRQVEAGVATATDERLAGSLALAAELDLQRTEREVVGAKRRLAALLSLEEDLLEVTLTDTLAASADRRWPEREALIAESLRRRPDLRAAERAVAAAEHEVLLERRRATPDVALGVSAERPEDGAEADLFLGPGAAIELPLFDRNQAQVTRAELELAARRRELEALVAETTQELRTVFDQSEVAARAAAFAHDELVPQAERTVSLAERAFELGDTTVLTLLQAQRTLLEARRVQVETELEAALAGIALQRAAGFAAGGESAP